MPQLRTLDLTDTTIPGGVRRRAWAAPEVRSHSLVVLTLARLYLAPQAGPPSPDTLAAVDSTPDLNLLLGPLTTVVELPTVRRVVLDLRTNTVKLQYMTGGMNAARVAVAFETPEAADGFFSKVWRRLGDGFELTPHKPALWPAAGRPVAVMAGILFATVTLALAVSIADDFAGQAAGPRTPFEAALGWMDWRVVCGVGGAALAVAQAWLYRRFTRPPARLELLPR